MRARPTLRAVLATVVAWLPSAPGAGETLLQGLGERFYHQGLGLDGAAVEAVVQADIRVPSTEMPCVNCHRRSGFGTAEGPVTTPPVTGPALFAPVTRGSAQMGTVKATGPGTRPAYTGESLLRALRDGVDPAGRTLSPTMPRYALNDETGAALTAYLRSMSVRPPPGISPDSVQFATITTPEVSAERRASMVDVLSTYVRHKNANTRNETGRRERGPWDMARHVGKYRNWALHEWTLKGAASEWPAQLAEFYRLQPVFAIIGGLGDGDWAPVHEFAERERLPVILPQVALAPLDGSPDGFYSLYFSKGLGLEVDLLARQLTSQAAGAHVLQVSRCGTAGHKAATALGRLSPETRSECLDRATPLTSVEWLRMVSGRRDTLVLWLGPPDVAAIASLAAATPGAPVATVFVSSTLLGERVSALPAWIAERALVLHPFVPPDELDRHAFRALAWLKANALGPADRGVAINALFAAALVADAISHPRTLDSREYFIERIEHLASRSPHRSTYPALSLGPGVRIASARGYVLKPPSSPGARFGRVAEWSDPSL